MVPKNSRKYILDSLAGYSARDEIRIHLAKNNPSPVDADIVIGDLTECDFNGYAYQNPVWGAAALDGSFVASIETGVLEWTAGGGFTGTQTIYGVYATILNRSDGVTRYLLFWDRLDASVTLAAVGQKFRRICKMQDTNYAP